MVLESAYSTPVERGMYDGRSDIRGDSMTRYVYIAAPMSGDPSTYLANVARMASYSRHLIDAGACTLNPAGDILEGLARPVPMGDDLYKRRSMDMLRLLAGRGDAAMHVLATEHRDGSTAAGVAAEITEAQLLGIPVKYVQEEDR